MRGIEIPIESIHDAYERGKRESAAEIERLRAALKPFAEWDEMDESTHGFLSDPTAWAAAKTAYEQSAPEK